jgi:hypothetical protein
MTDFFFNCWCLEIPSDNRIGHDPCCGRHHAQSYQREALQMENVNSEYSYMFELFMKIFSDD